VIELYILKAKIYKHVGDTPRAATLYDEARKLDLADRYLNAVSSRYHIRNDNMALFSKETDGTLNVHDMQCMWYESESGFSYLRQNNLRLALKNFNFIEKHFETIYEDQFDFHLFGLRKFAINAYFEMLDMEDNIYCNKFAVQAALGMIKVAKKASKLNAAEEIARIKPEIEEYKASKEYKALQDEIRKKDEDDDFKTDSDPKGYELYEKFVSR
jgi:N-alpha-acetyltransferase 15/16, NatA auxiliary subunit